MAPSYLYHHYHDESWLFVTSCSPRRPALALVAPPAGGPRRWPLPQTRRALRVGAGLLMHLQR